MNSHLQLIFGRYGAALPSITQKLLNKVCDVSSGDGYSLDRRTNDVSFSLKRVSWDSNISLISSGEEHAQLGSCLRGLVSPRYGTTGDLLTSNTVSRVNDHSCQCPILDFG